MVLPPWLMVNDLANWVNRSKDCKQITKKEKKEDFSWVKRREGTTSVGGFIIIGVSPCNGTLDLSHNYGSFEQVYLCRPTIGLVRVKLGVILRHGIVESMKQTKQSFPNQGMNKGFQISGQEASSCVKGALPLLGQYNQTCYANIFGRVKTTATSSV